VNVGAKVVVVSAAEDDQRAGVTKPCCEYSTVPCLRNRREADPAAPRRRDVPASQPPQDRVRSPSRIQGWIARRIAVTQIARSKTRGGQPEVRPITRNAIPATDLHGTEPCWRSRCATLGGVAAHRPDITGKPGSCGRPQKRTPPSRLCKKSAHFRWFAKIPVIEGRRVFF